MLVVTILGMCLSAASPAEASPDLEGAAPAWSPVVIAAGDERLEELARAMDEVRRGLADAKARGAEREAAELQRALAELEQAAAAHQRELARDAAARAEHDEARKAMHEVELAMQEARRGLEESRARGDEGAVREWTAHLDQLEHKADRLRNSMRESPPPSDRRPDSAKRPDADGDLHAARERMARMEKAENALREAGMNDMASAVCLERIALGERIEREMAARTDRAPARHEPRRDDAAARHEQAMARIERLEAAMAELNAHVRRLHDLVESMRPRAEESRPAR
jgi:DNA repair exonuclease SbcCD ATPase subunit